MSRSTDPAANASSGFVAVFIRRPILAMVVSLLIVIAGLAALLGVEVRELPDVDQPVVSVRAIFPGAAPDAVDEEVTSIIENAVAQVNGVVSISSSSSYQVASVTAEFSPNVDIDIAAADVKNAVSAIRRQLPDALEEPNVSKSEGQGGAGAIMRVVIYSPGMDEGDLGDLIDRIITPRLQAVEGVASVDSYGVRRKVIRVRLSAVELAARGLTVDDVARLVRTANVNAPSGTLKSGAQELLIRAEAPATTPEAIAEMRLAPDAKLSDVAVVEWGVQQETTLARYNNAPAAGVGIVRAAQSNTVKIADGIYQAVDELKASLPGVEMVVTTDDAIFIRRAIEEVVLALGLSVLIVVGVIFVFLRSLRQTLIPAFAIPISLIGSVAAIWLAGFSINILTLLALLMATGLVVDDAIVVTENIQRWRAKGAGPRAAALIGSREIMFAVMATTATLIAVFMPISFMPGKAGRLFSEFGFVLAFSVFISSIVALTLCPMLTVKFSSKKDAASQGPEETAAGARRRGLAALYGPALRAALARPGLAFGAAILFAAGAVGVFSSLPKELTPVEDRGRIFAIAGVQQSANFDYLRDKIQEVETRMQAALDGGDGDGVMSLVGLGDSTRAFVFVRLKDWSERKNSQQEIEAMLRPSLAAIPGLNLSFRTSNSLGIRGGGQGLQFAVAADDYDAAADAADAIAAKLEESPTFTRVALNFQTSQPQINVEIDREAATRLGVDIDAVSTLLATMADEFKAGEVFVGDKAVDILLSGGGEPVDDPNDLANLFVRTADGRFVPLSLIASIREVAVAANLSREQRRRAVPVTASLADGAEISDAIAELREVVAAGALPQGMSMLLLGEARLIEQASSNALIVFAFAALVVLLVLAAQFESFVSALVIMTTAPFGLAAAVYAMKLTGGSFNYYSQIGLVLLIGIMAKNGILIVEFANQLRDRGLELKEAVETAALTRLRPVLMTALSTVLGGLPLIFGHGAGAESRAALGWVVVGGLGFATIFTLFLTPAAYLLIGRFAQVRAGEAEKVERELAAAGAIDATTRPSPAE
jgi:HAE1 family hydrophobic/amphiphilic exporter-1